MRHGLGAECTNASEWWSYSRTGYIAGEYARCTADWNLLGPLDAGGVPLSFALMRSLLLPTYGAKNIVYLYRRPPTVAPENHGAWAAGMAKRLCEQADPGTIWAIEPTNEVSYAWYPPCTAANPGWPDYGMLAAWLVDIYAQVKAAVAPFGVRVIGPTIGTSKSVPECNAFIAAGGLSHLDAWAFHDYFDTVTAPAIVADKITFYRSLTSLPLMNSECGFHDLIATPPAIHEYAAYHAAHGVALIGHQWVANTSSNVLHGYWDADPSNRLLPTAKLTAILSGWDSVVQPSPVPPAGPCPCREQLDRIEALLTVPAPPVLPTVSQAELDAVPNTRHDAIAEIVRRHKGKVIVE